MRLKILTEDIFEKMTAKQIIENGIKHKRNFNYEKGLNALIRLDNKGSYIYDAGAFWKEVDYPKAFNALIKVDKIGKWIHNAGKDWGKFDYKKALDALILNDKTGEWIYKSGIKWEKFNYLKAFKKLKTLNNKWFKAALKYWPKDIKRTKTEIEKLRTTSKKLPNKAFKLKESVNELLKEEKDINDYIEVQYANKPFFIQLKRVYRAVKKTPYKNKQNKIRFYKELTKKLPGNKETISKIIADVFKKKQTLSPNEFNKLLISYEIPQGKRFYVKKETAYQDTQRLMPNKKLNKTISVSIFGDIYEKILKDFKKDNPKDEETIININKNLAGHFTDASSFIRWTNVAPWWIHIDAFQTDFFNKLKAMSFKDKLTKMDIVNKFRKYQNEFFKTAFSYIVRKHPNVKVWTANTPSLVKSVEDVRGGVKLLELYKKLPKALGFRLISIDKLKQILRTRPSKEQEKLIKKVTGKINLLDNVYNITKRDINDFINNFKSLFSLQYDKKPLKQFDMQDKKRKINDLLFYIPGDESDQAHEKFKKIASGFHQHLDELASKINTEKDIDKAFSNTMIESVFENVNKGSKKDSSLNIWWGNKGMLFEEEEIEKLRTTSKKLPKKTFKLEECVDELSKTYM